MRFKKSKLSLVLCGVFLALNAEAQIEFDPTRSDYDDVVVPSPNGVILDKDAEPVIQIVKGEHNYNFNKGGTINNLVIGELNRFSHGFSEDEPPNELNFNVTSGLDSTLTIGNNAEVAFLVSYGRSAKFSGGNFVFTTHDTKGIVAEVYNHSDLTVSGNSITFDGGHSSVYVHTDHNNPTNYTRPQIFKASAKNDVVMNQYDAQCNSIYALSGWNSNTIIEIDAGGDIVMKHIGDDYDFFSQGIFARSHHDDQYGKLYSTSIDIKLTAGNKILIDNYAKGVELSNDTHLLLQAKSIDINVLDYGLWLYGPEPQYNDEGVLEEKRTEAELVASEIAINAHDRAIRTDEYSTTSLNASHSISINNEGGDPLSLAIETSGKNSQLYINKSQTDIGKLTLNGGIASHSDGVTEIYGGVGSVFKGWTQETDPDDVSSVMGSVNFSSTGRVDLELGANSKWILSKDSSLTSLTMNNSVIDFSSFQQEQQDGSVAVHKYRSLKAKTLAGNGNTFDMHIDLVNESADKKLLDQLIVTDRVEGKHVGRIFFENIGHTDKNHSVNWLVSQADGSMTITAPDGGNKFAAPGALTYWALKFVDANTTLDSLTFDEIKTLPNEGNGAGNWYLVRVDKPTEPEKPVEPDKPVEPENPNNPDKPVIPDTPTNPDQKPDLVPEVVDNLRLATSTGQAMAYFSDLEDLRKRIGEVRYGAQAGVWAKAFAKEEKVNNSYSGFKQEGSGINVGFDTLMNTSNNASWLVGGAFRYGKADQEGLGTRELEGELEEYSVKGYATWIHDSGSYADFVLQAGRYKQELSGLDNSSYGRSKADYNTWGYGASVEVGHIFKLGGDDNQWFAEPQFELSYFQANGENYKTSTGLSVIQSDAEFLTGRAGVVVGKKFNYGSLEANDHRWFQVAALGGVKHELLGGDQKIRYAGVDNEYTTVKADDFAGTRFYYGINADWQVSDKLRFFAQVDREKGDNYTKSWYASLGFKYMF